MSVTPEGVALEVGMEIEASFRGMTYRPAHITKIRPDGSCDVEYFDGDVEYRVQASLIRAVNDSKQQDEDDGEQEDNNQSSNQQSNYNQGNGASRAGEVTGIVLRKTGKTLSAFGENMLKNLLAEDEPQKRSDHSRRPKERRRYRGASEERREDPHIRRLPSAERRRGPSVERRGLSMEPTSRSRLQSRKESTRGGSVERRGYSMDRHESKHESSRLSPQPRVIRPPRSAPPDEMESDDSRRRSSKSMQPNHLDGYQSLDEDDLHTRNTDSVERSATNPKQRGVPPLRKDASKRKIDRSGEAITVGVRIRPLIAEKWETKLELKECFVNELDRTVLEMDDAGTVTQSWSFDYVWGNTVPTQTVFDELALPIVDKAVDGINGTIFAYGQTASGKTYSMFGNEDNPGITSRAVFALFDKVKESKFSQFLIRGSFIELYNEEIVDLLASEGPNQVSSRLRIQEDAKTGAFVKGAVERLVEHPESILDMIQFGEKNRHYGSTNMNDKSSRSHVIVRLVIKRGFVVSNNENETNLDEEQVWHANPNIPQRVSSLNFVDLAGSEKVKKTGATGTQLKESNAINKSLLTLGTVINRLSDGAKGQHIPYRDSKLTHLLSASLGGNASTAMLACISATDFNREETLSSLRYASRAKKILNVAEMNEVDNLESFMDNYWNEVELMKRQVLEAKQAGYDMTAESEREKEILEKTLIQTKDALQMEKHNFERDMEKLKEEKDQELNALKQEFDASVLKLEEIMAERDNLKSETSHELEIIEQQSRHEVELKDMYEKKLLSLQESYEGMNMRVEELDMLRLEDLEDCDKEVQKQFIKIETKDMEIVRLNGILGLVGEDGEEGGEEAGGQNYVQIISDQNISITERDTMILQLQQQLESMTTHATSLEKDMTKLKNDHEIEINKLTKSTKLMKKTYENERLEMEKANLAHITELENALDETSLQLSELNKLHNGDSASNAMLTEEVKFMEQSIEKLNKNLESERNDRRKYRDENNMLRGRLSAMDKIGAATVAVVLGGGKEEDEQEEKKNMEQALMDELNDRISELQHENESLTAISADYKDHVSEKFGKYELKIESLNSKLKILTEQSNSGETQRTVQLRQELRDLEEKYNKDTHKLRVAYMELEDHYSNRDSEALTLIGESSPLVRDALHERESIKAKLGAIQEEQDELIADLEKSVHKVADQDEIINSLTEHLEECSRALAEQGEDLKVLLEENSFLRLHIDRTSRVAAAAMHTRDGEKSHAWNKEVSDLGSSIQNSIADELRSAYDEVRASNQEVTHLRELLEHAQEKSVSESYRMAQHLRSFRTTLEEVNEVEVRLADLHDQATAVSSAHEKLAEMESKHMIYKQQSEARIAQLEIAARPQQNIREVSLKSLPEGFILWYHSHVNPQVSDLALIDHRDNLLSPHPKAYVSSVMPEGILLDIDRNAVASELLSFPDLEDQLESLVPDMLSERQFWINYFSHKHGVKINVAEEADRMAASAPPGSRGFIMRAGASAHLRQQFIEAMREAGVHLKMHQGNEVVEVVLWLKTPTELAWSPDFTVFPPKEQYAIPFSEVDTITAGKETEVLMNGEAQWADPDCCFSFNLHDGGSLDFESNSKDENFTFIEGVNMLLKDAQSNEGKPSYNAMEFGKGIRAEPMRDTRLQDPMKNRGQDLLTGGGGYSVDEHNYGPPPNNHSNNGYGNNGQSGQGHNGGYTPPNQNNNNNGYGGGNNNQSNQGNAYQGGGNQLNSGYGQGQMNQSHGYGQGGNINQLGQSYGNNGNGYQVDEGTRFERWLADAGLDSYLPALSGAGVNSMENLARLQHGTVDQIARQVGMKPNEAVKFSRLQSQLRQ